MSRNLEVSENMRACSMGVYARRSFEEGGMKERVRRRHACGRDVSEMFNEGGDGDVRILIDRP